jgi:hypothetical protein
MTKTPRTIARITLRSRSGRAVLTLRVTAPSRGWSVTKRAEVEQALKNAGI